ncbi:hypothetical protein AGR8A_pTi20177 [Agrobacterium fabrum str. J-07]|nr:hypothetical protein AGR8A_pTi20177 [Agrobacterium fabrum str. J-07]
MIDLDEDKMAMQFWCMLVMIWLLFLQWRDIILYVLGRAGHPITNRRDCQLCPRPV